MIDAYRESINGGAKDPVIKPYNLTSIQHTFPLSILSFIDRDSPLLSDEVINCQNMFYMATTSIICQTKCAPEMLRVKKSRT